MQLHNKKVFITGCGGMLGNAIYPYFKARAPEILAIDIVIEQHEKDWLNYLDVREPEQLKKAFREFQPDLVLHLAALVDVERCEQDPAGCRIDVQHAGWREDLYHGQPFMDAG